MLVPGTAVSYVVSGAKKTGSVLVWLDEKRVLVSQDGVATTQRMVVASALTDLTPPPPVEPPPTHPPTEPPPTEPPPTEPPPTEPPPSSGWPDATNTGVVNEAALRMQANPGTVTYIQQDGQVVQDTVFDRAVVVYANNVTFRNCRFKHNQDYQMLRVDEAYGGILIEDCEFDGLGGTDINAAIAGPRWTLRRCEIQGVQDGAKLHEDTNVYDCYIHNLYVYGIGDPHYDGLQSMGGGNNNIVHNTIDVGVGPGRNAAVLLKTDFGPVNNARVENNRLLGGGYSLMMGKGYTGLLPTNVRVINNRFGQHAYDAINYSPGMVFERSGNVWDVTATAGTPGQPIPGG